MQSLRPLDQEIAQRFSVKTILDIVKLCVMNSGVKNFER